MVSGLIFYTNPMSRGRIARWMLEETGADYDTVVLDYGTTMQGADYLAINPMGKVPAIVHDGRVVTECAAIRAYLAEAFPEAGLAPRLHERADYYRWMFFAAGPIEQAVTTKAMGFDPPAERQRMLGYGSYDLMVETIAGWLGSHDYVAGDRFTAADVYIGSQISWGTQFGTLPKRDVFDRYLARVLAREAYRRASARDDALMAAASEAPAGAA